ncbi:MAG: hypothetical protein KDA44_10135 [Planctomycetales bacterium]|nr:hypothetical protein [Planctomycetales bacterium]
MLIRSFVFSLLLALLTGLQAQAQSSYASQQLGNLNYGNSTRQYTAGAQYSRIINQGLNINAGLYSPVNQQLKSQLASAYRPPTRPANKPFINANSGPSVTPYLSLSSPFSSTADTYYTQVRPQMAQQQMDQRQQAQNARFQHQLNSMAAKPPFDPQGSDQIAPTGHAAVFQNTLGYYPQASNGR